MRFINVLLTYLLTFPVNILATHKYKVTPQCEQAESPKTERVLGRTLSQGLRQSQTLNDSDGYMVQNVPDVDLLFFTETDSIVKFL